MNDRPMPRRTHLSRSLLALAVLASTPLAAPAAASTLSVQTARVHAGGSAARIDLSRTCAEEDRTIADGTEYAATATEEACRTLAANDVDVLTGADVTFRGGERVALGPGFSVGSGASFRVVVAPEVAGSSYVESRHPQAVPELWARFYLDLGDLALADGESFVHLAARDGAGGLELAVGVRRDAALGENRLFLRAVDDGGAVTSTEGSAELPVPAGWRTCELRWRASSGAGDGLAEVCVDDVPGGTSCIALTGLDNDTGRIDSLRWGVLELPPGDLGTLYMDDFRARTAGPIGGCDSTTCP